MRPPPFLSALEVHNVSNGGPEVLAYYPLALLDLNELPKVPSELRGHIVVVSHVVHINKFVAQNCIQYELVVDMGIALHVKIVIGTVTEVMSLLVLCIESLRSVELSVVNQFSQAIPGLDVDLLPGWGQINVLDMAPGTIKINVIFLVEDVVVIERRQHKHRVVEESSSCSCENWLNENRSHHDCVYEGMEQKCGARQIEVLLVEIIASDWINFAVSWVVDEVEFGWRGYDCKVSGGNSAKTRFLQD